MKEKNKNYDEINKYDFYAKYYMHYTIGTRFEDCVEINEQEYRKLKHKLNNSKDAMVKVFATYTVGFYQSEDTYVLKAVDKDVFYCLYNSQRYEKNKVRHERERYLHRAYNSENIEEIPSKNFTENEALKDINNKDVRAFLDSILTEKQSKRFYKNIMEEIPIVVIAVSENAHPSSVRESIESAKKIVEKNLKKKNKKI